MARKRHTAEEIVIKLRQVDVLMAQGQPVAEPVRDWIAGIWLRQRFRESGSKGAASTQDRFDEDSAGRT